MDNENKRNMAAKDYIFVTGMSTAYLAKKQKTERPTMSMDRRPVTDNEIIGLFEFYLRKYCGTNKTDMITITKTDGTPLFSAKLLDETHGEF